MLQRRRISGSLAAPPFTLTWIYISWYIALIGCRPCYALDASLKPEPQPAIRAAAAREVFVMRVIVALAQLHRECGAPVRVQAVVRELGVTGRLAREGLAALASAGLAVEARQGGWLLSREPSRITLAEVRVAARATLPFPAQQPDDITAAVQSCLVRAEGAPPAALAGSLCSFPRRVRAP